MGPDDLVLLTGRSHQRVSDAAREVAQLPGTHSHVEGRVLDVTDAEAIARLADELRARHGGVDVVLSNAVARLLPEESQAERADEFIDVSNTATHAILRSFGPVLRPGGRLIVVASSLGTLGHLNPRLHHLFDGASLDQVEYAVESWRSAVHNKTAEEAGWPRWLNVPSKVAQVAAVRAVAAERREHDLADDTLIASVCPGMVDTATSRPWFSDFSQAQSPSEAARAVLDLVFTEHLDPALYGELIRFGKALPWHDGTPPVEQDRLLKP
jgi:NAD(P)-dependent dehydrogenase (short-subunit alcohol dehydrogenase family)